MALKALFTILLLHLSVGFSGDLEAQLGFEEIPVVAGAAAPSSTAEPEAATGEELGAEHSLVTGATQALPFASLKDEYLAVFGILMVSVVLAMRRRAHVSMRLRGR